MLKTMRKHRRSVMGIVIVAVIAMTMSGFGVNLIGTPSRPYAIKVGDREVSYERFAQVRRSIEGRYRQMFGANTDQFIKSLGINTAEQAVDTTIESELLLALAEEMGLEASDKAIQEMLVKDLFQGQFDKQRYATFLQTQGMSAKQFEEDLKKDVIRKQVASLFEDSAKPSMIEARAQLKREKTSYSFSVATIKSADLVSEVAEPEASEIEKYYDQNLSEFQIPATVSYRYLTLIPTQILDKVQVAEEDIEIEYSDNSNSYKTEPEVRYSQIVLKFNDKASEEQKAQTRNKASDLLKKIKDGAKFEDIARSSSQDIGSALKAGDTGWASKSTLNQSLSEKLFSLDVGELSDSVETDKAIYILRLDEVKEAKQKELVDVRNEIIAKIKKQEAPAILALEAQAIYEKWSKEDKPVEAVVSEILSTVNSEPKEVSKLEADKDPSTELSGLTAKVISNSGDKKQLIEQGDMQIFVELKELKEEGLKTLEEVKGVITQKLKINKAKELSKQKADESKKLVSSAIPSEFTNLLEPKGFKIEQFLDLNKSSAKGLLADPEIREKVFINAKTPLILDQVFTSDDSYAIIKIDSLKEPAAEELEKSLEGTLEGLTRENSEIALESYLSKAKAQVKIDVQPSLYNN
jgi:peptidyl-prolyl cis-trans isomerase D